MADYREISQAYAQGAAKVAVLINGAAAIAILSQVLSLNGIRFEVTFALLSWAAGVFFGALAWPLGFAATRYVDKAEQENDEGHKRTHERTSDRFMYAGLIVVTLSLLLFLKGCILMAWGIGHLP
jgi:hypothetical protein